MQVVPNPPPLAHDLLSFVIVGFATRLTLSRLAPMMQEPVVRKTAISLVCLSLGRCFGTVIAIFAVMVSGTGSRSVAAEGEKRQEEPGAVATNALSQRAGEPICAPLLGKLALPLTVSGGASGTSAARLAPLK